MNLEIVITEKWCHPEFGGIKQSHIRYKMGEAEKAELKYLELTQPTQFNPCYHVYIDIVEVNND